MPSASVHLVVFVELRLSNWSELPQLLHVHRELTDKLGLAIVANELVSRSEHRSTLFGTLEPGDLL